jgi:hypothetical protein
MAKSSVSNSGSSYSQLANTPAYMEWVRREKFSTDYFNPEYLSEYGWLQSQGMV